MDLSLLSSVRWKVARVCGGVLKAGNIAYLDGWNMHTKFHSEDQLGDKSVGGINTKTDIKKRSLKLWTGLIWLSVGSGEGILWRL